MAAACSVCRTEFSWLGRLSGKTVCRNCRKAAGHHYRDLLTALVEHRADPRVAGARLQKLAAEAGFEKEKQLQLNGQAFRQLLAAALAQRDSLSEREEADLKIAATAEALDFDEQALGINGVVSSDLLTKWAVARVNAGRLEVISDPKILLKKGEIAHLEVAAQLLKEVRHTIRQYGGFSFRIMKGVYYHVGQSHPLSSTEIETADAGTLTVTSQRVVYAGDRQSLEMLYTKLLAVKIFTDGIEFNLANRKNAPLFRLTQGFGHVVAATVNAAIQRQTH